MPTYASQNIVPDATAGSVAAPYVINVETANGINTIVYNDGYSPLQNVPNPFSRQTGIDYAIPSAQHITITLYDESGRLVAELINGEQVAGKHHVSFLQEDLQSGVYFYQMKAGDFSKTRRMLIIK